jgi:NAD(P)-dependent dehydrogenase (short-subunit alcohol dehydrogenase family)
VAKLNGIAADSALPFTADLSTPDAAARSRGSFPDVEIVVANLGIFEPRAFEEITRRGVAALLQCQRTERHPSRAALFAVDEEKNWGRIIFISSESGVQIPPEMIHYGVTKTAQLAVSRGLAEALAGTGITVNCVLPGPTRSRGVEEFVTALAKREGKTFTQFETEFFQKVRPTSLIKRFAKPEEVASLVVYVASPLSSATTGAALRVDGGVVKSAV